MRCQIVRPDQADLILAPPSQREVVTLRDSEGWNTEEVVCNILQITETNQRVVVTPRSLSGFGERWSNTSLEREPDLR